MLPICPTTGKKCHCAHFFRLAVVMAKRPAPLAPLFSLGCIERRVGRSPRRRVGRASLRRARHSLMLLGHLLHDLDYRPEPVHRSLRRLMGNGNALLSASSQKPLEHSGRQPAQHQELLLRDHSLIRSHWPGSHHPSKRPAQLIQILLTKRAHPHPKLSKEVADRSTLRGVRVQVPQQGTSSRGRCPAPSLRGRSL